MKRSNMAWAPSPDNASIVHDPRAYDVEAALKESQRLTAEHAADANAPLMDALVHSSRALGCVPIVILEYSRNDEWFRQALSTAPELEERRKAIVDAGWSVELSCGAKSFVVPHFFEIVEKYLQDRSIELSRRHVIVEESMEQAVRQVLEVQRQSIRRQDRGSFKLKSKMHVDVAIAQSLTMASLVKRTFIHIDIPSSMRSVSSIRPNTF